MKPRVIVLQHADVEHLGLIAEVFDEQGVEYRYVRADLGQDVPESINDFQGLVIMGGPQSVCNDDEFPYLKAEKALARKAVDANLPVLGVCLGSQILADALGARCFPGKGFEVGWKEVELNEEIRNDEVFGHLPETFVPLHWHGDVFDLPSTATNIGSSKMTPTQGFVADSRFYATLFHLEQTMDQLTSMAAAFPDDLKRGGVSAEELLSEAPVRLNALRGLALATYRRWTQLL